MHYDRFDWADALYTLCTLHHSGQWSKGYRILSKLLRQYRYRPGLSVERGHLSDSANELYERLASRYANQI
jgi:hypothetical protein